MKKVIVYSADFCGYCTKTKEWLTHKGVPFTALDVTKPEIQEEFSRYNIPGIPLIFITDEETGNTEQIRGFNIEKLTAALF
ncbi:MULTISPECIES: glutaredoxin family protein [Bacillota]|uniref:glutaredoxin family protein n=1 Tax=Bacillota TaxID=1239 RepID=UPI000302B5CF|nr:MULTISPECIES: glutaredoxin family protein [Bacillota]NRG29485.1 glutaredoxin family protein [Niallia circulans]